MPTLALDTSTQHPSLALVGGTGPFAERVLDGDGGGRLVLSAVHELLSEAGLAPADLTRIVVGVGPGSFTGLRIGIATALGLGQALNRPVIGASSLEALSLGVAAGAPAGPVAAAIDARRGEVFGAAFLPGPDGLLTVLIPPCAAAPTRFAEALAALGEAVTIGGSGALAYPELCGGSVRALPADHPGHLVRAAALVERVEAGAGRPARPDYQRLSDAEAALNARTEAG